MRTEQTTREKRVHRENMMLYVFMPSRDAAAAWMMIGAGIGLTISANAAYKSSVVFSSALFIIALMSLFGGAGWHLMIKSRLNAYYYDIMQERAIEETITTEHDEPNTAPRRIPNGNGEIVVELAEQSNVKPEEWRKIATAVLVNRTSISKASLSKNKDTKVISQPCYDRFYSYMNEQGYMRQADGVNHLTHDGKQYLSQHLPTLQPYSTVTANGS